MTSVAVTLARWAAELEPDEGEEELAHRSLLDTVAVTLAARDHRVTKLAAGLPEGARWAVAGHVLEAEVHTADGTVRRARQQYPPGSPARPPTAGQLAAKLADCVRGLARPTRDGDPAQWTWDNAATTLRRYLP
jgi:hypothetical protein